MPFIPQEPSEVELQPESVKRSVVDVESMKPEAREKMNMLLKQSDPKNRPSELSDEPPPPKTIEDKIAAAAVVLNRYRIEYKNDWDIPMSITSSKELIRGFIERNESIELILPAFPFKSSNKSTKVLGSLPDEAERVSLQHLNGLCESVKEATENDCHLTIISDGIAYNDLLDVSDSEVWTYGQTLRSMAKELGCSNIRFSRMYQLLGSEYSHLTTLTEEQYLEMVPGFRKGLESNLPDGYNVSEELSKNADVNATYCGYKKFLETERDVKLGRSRADKENADLAKRMLNRGKAFAEAIKKRFPVSVRLSIHPSTDVNKISIALLPQDNEVPMTPWHGVAVRKIDGTITMMHAHKVLAVSHELVYQNGRPMYFRERSDLFAWNGKDVEFEYLYPTGLIVRPRDIGSAKYALCTVDMQKVRKLSELCSPVCLRGFTDTTDRRAFTAKAYDLGPVLPWEFGVIQEVKDTGNSDPSSNSVQSREAMPMHFDGVFKLKTVKDEQTGEEKQVSDAPRFQYFVCQAAAPAGDGYTLFASSPRFVDCLPQSYNIKKMSKIRWSSHSHGYFQIDLTNTALIEPHPSLGTPCVRWLQPWPRWKTAYNSHDVSIDNGSQNLVSLIDSILFDRRVCLYFTWEKGDIVVSDNYSTLHTRTAFRGNVDRELWRIHIG